jgi:hypothetical protein
VPRIKRKCKCLKKNPKDTRNELKKNSKEEREKVVMGARWWPDTRTDGHSDYDFDNS